MQKQFLISHRGALGDFLLTWPALIALKRHFKEFIFIGAGKPDYLELAQYLGIIDQYKDCESREMLSFYSGKKVPDALRPLAGVLCWAKSDPEFTSFLQQQQLDHFHIHPPFPEGNSMHVRDHHLLLLNHFKVPVPIQRELLLPFPVNPEPLILIHPGSGSVQKNFEPDFYLFIARELQNQNFTNINFVLGPCEQHLKSRFTSDYQIIEPGSLLELAQTISRGQLFIGNDSGVTHLSALLGTPSIALYKNTDPRVWGTTGIKTRNIEAQTEAQVMVKVQKALSDLNIHPGP